MEKREKQGKIFSGASLLAFWLIFVMDGLPGMGHGMESKAQGAGCMESKQASYGCHQFRLGFMREMNGRMG